jgi:hypothetical protein
LPFVADSERAAMPGGIRPLLRRALGLYRARPLVYIGLTAFVVVPVELAILVLSLAAPDPSAATTDITRIDAAATALLVLPLSVGATTHAVAAQLAGRVPSLRESLAAVLPRASLLVGTTVVAAILSFAGLVLFVLPGLVLLVWFQFACQVVVLEGSSFWPALRRCRELVRGAFWQVVVIDLAILVVSVAGTVLVAAVTLLFTLPTDASDRSRLAIRAIGSIPADVLVLPFSSIALTLVYVGLRAARPAAAR